MVSQQEIIALLNTLQNEVERLSVEVEASRNNEKNKNKMLADLLLRVARMEKKIDINKRGIDSLIMSYTKFYAQFVEDEPNKEDYIDTTFNNLNFKH